jgi:predicted metal-dependent peptidase
MDQEALKKLTKARAGLILDAPFFGSLALRQILKEDPSAKTAWINGAELGYNPEFIKGLTLEECKGILAHEVLHLAALHHTRRQDRRPDKWNQAADYAINDILLDAKFVLPKGILSGYGRDESAESIYSKLPDPPEGNGQGDGQGGGSAAGNDPGNCGEVRDYPGKDGRPADSSEMAQAEAESKTIVAQAIQQARAMGKTSAALERLIGQALKPKVDWKEALRQFVDRTAKNDYSWTAPNRRYLSQGLYLPSLKSDELPPIIIAIDTSGSIAGPELDQFSAEISAILSEFQTGAKVIYCDAKIKNIEEFTSEELPLKLHPAGGGGTDFRPPFEHVRETGENPPCLIYCTDGESYSFPNEPEYPVLWATIDAYNFTPPFGEVIEIQ